MDRVRVAVAATGLAIAGCRGAAAEAGPPDEHDSMVPRGVEPRHGIDVPADWKELPAVGEAAVRAARGVLGEAGEAHGHAWGEPSRGCYLAVVELHGTERDSIPNLLREVQAAFEGAPASIELSDLTTSPDADDHAELQARFTAPATAAAPRVDGALRVHLVLDGRRTPHALAAACFYNDREPAACEEVCAPLLSMLAPLLPSPPP